MCKYANEQMKEPQTSQTFTLLPAIIYTFSYLHIYTLAFAIFAQ